MRFMRTSTRLAILAFAFSLTSCGPPADEIVDITVTDSAEVESTGTRTLQETQAATDAQTQTATDAPSQTATASPTSTGQPSAVPSSTPTQSAQSFEVDQRQSADKNSASSGYTVLIDEIGAIMVEVPIEWSDVDITPESLDGETESPAIRASSDLAAFYQGWDEPGIEFLVSSLFTEIYASPAEYLDDEAPAYLAAGCVLAARHDYDDGLYSGQLDEWVLCDEQGEEGAVLILAVTPIDNPWDYMIALGIQVVVDDDWNSVDTILESFIVINDLTAEFTTEDEVSIDAPIEQQPADDLAQAGTWTILVYLMADNDLEHFAGLDLEEMLSIDASAGLNLIVLADRSPLDEDYDPAYTGSDFVGLGDWNDTRLLLFGDHDVSVLPPLSASAEDLNMGAADTLANFIEFGLSNYPADRNALIFWDHGAGWPGMGPDEFAGGNPVEDTLDLSEIKTGISSGLSRVTVERLDLVGFDACLMATYEVAAAMTGLADYMVASEELEPGHGWDYNSLAVLSGNSDIIAKDLGSAITDGFQSQAQAWDTDESITLSVLDLTVFPEFQNAIEDLLDPLVSDLAPAAPSVSRALNDASRFASSPNPAQDSHIVDLGNFVEGLSGIGMDDEIERVLNVLDRLVVDKVSGIATKRASGLSVYFPQAADYADMNYLDLDVAPAWQSFLESFLVAGEEIPKTSRAKLNHEETTIDYYFDSDGLSVSAQFDPAAQDNITEVILYYAVIDPADDMLYYIGEDPGWINDDGTVSAFYDLAILTMSDGFDTSYAYTYFSVDEDENLYFFDIPLGYTPSSELESDEPIHDVELSLAIDGETGEILSAVYYEVDDSGQWGELIADPEGAIFPVVQMEDDDGSVVWVSASDLWLYADLDELTYSFEPLPPETTLIADLYVYDYGGHSDYVSIETTVPDPFGTD
jgi:hypothetical protein